MKTAVIGTTRATVEGNESTLLREAGITYLQRLSGYVPPVLPHDMPLNLSVADEFVGYADEIMSNYYGYKAEKSYAIAANELSDDVNTKCGYAR